MTAVVYQRRKCMYVGEKQERGEEGGESVLISPLDTYILFVSFTMELFL